MPEPFDYRYLTTPAGALAGVAIARALVRKGKRTAAQQLTGAALGAGVGYLGGSYINDAQLPKPDKDPTSYLKNVHKRWLGTKPGDAFGPNGTKTFNEATEQEINEFLELPQIRKVQADPKYVEKYRNDYGRAYYYDMLKDWAAREKMPQGYIDKLHEMSTKHKARIEGITGARNTIADKLNLG